jgi:hypothetical protein
MVVYGAGKERAFVLLCSTVYLSNFVTFVVYRNVVWRQKNIKKIVSSENSVASEIKKEIKESERYRLYNSLKVLF